MERGDISTTLPPRMLITFGRVIATPQSAVELATGVRGHGPPVTTLWDFTWRHNYKFDVITFLGEEMLEGVRHLLTQMGALFVNLLAEVVDALSKRLAT